MAADKKTLLRDALKLVQKGQIDKAIELYRTVVKNDPKDVKAHNELGDLYIKQGKKKEGIAEYLEVANHWEKDGFILRAIAICQKILNLDPELVTIRVRVADMYAKQKLPAEARTQYLQAADWYDKKGKVSEALEIFRKIADLEPQNLSVRVKLAGMFEKQKLPEKAAEECCRAAQAYWERGEHDPAAELFHRAVKLHPGNFAARRGLSEYHAGRKEWAMVVQALEPLMARDVHETDLVLRYAEACGHQGRGREAVEVLEKAQEREPNSVPVNLSLGRLLLASGDAEKGMAALNRAVSAYLAESKFEAAESLLREMADAAPEDDRILQRLLEVVQRRGDHAAAAKVYRRLAAVYERKGLVRSAVGALEKCLEMRPDDAQVAAKLAELRGAAAAAPKAPAPAPPPAPEPKAPAAPAPPEEVEEVVEIDLEGEDLTGVAVEEEELDVEVEAEAGAPALPERPRTVAEIRLWADQGQFARAVGFLREFLGEVPGDLEARDLLRETFRRQGDRKGWREATLELADLHRRSGRMEEARRACREVLDAEPKNAAAAALLADLVVEEEAAAPAGPAPAEAGVPVAEMPAEEEALPTVEAAPEPAAAAAAEPEPEAAPEVPAARVAEVPATVEPPPPPVTAPEPLPAPPEEIVAAEEVDLAAGADLALPPPLPAEEEPPPVPPAPEPVAEAPAAAPPADEISLDGLGVDLTGFAPPPPPAPPEPEPLGAARGPAGSAELEEFLAEANFYFQQGLIDEAEFIYHKLLKLVPGHPEIANRLRSLEELRRSTMGERALAVPSGAEAGEDLSALDRELDRVLPAGGEPGLREPAPQAPAPRAGEGDFSDFLSELRRELEESALEPEPVAAAPTEVGLTDMVQDFRRSVKEQLGEEDVETHYNLGIAFKEMGLMAEALAEFGLAEKSAARRADAVSMISLCLREMGQPEEALRRLEQGAAAAARGSEEWKSLAYDLADLQRQQGAAADSLEWYRRIHAADPGYRDVAARLRDVAAQAGVGRERRAEEGESGSPPRKKPKVSYL